MQKILILIGLLSFCSCSNSTQENPTESIAETSEQKVTQFEFLPSSATGVSFANKITHDVNTNFNLLSYQYFYNGSGVGIGDLDNDGLQDLVFASNMLQNKIYKNSGNFSFVDVTENSGLSSSNWTNGVCLADVDQNGFLDIYFSNGGPTSNIAERKNRLYLNQGDMQFVESATKFGVDDSNHSTQSSFFDYDLDGDLDLFVANHNTTFGMGHTMVKQRFSTDERLETVSSRLLRNDGKQGFTDITKQAGLLAHGYGLGLITADIDGDGWIDIYQCNDFTVPDFMYMNQGDGTFLEEVKEHTDQVSWNSMGVDFQDINGDAIPDMSLLDMAASDHIASKTMMASMNPKSFNSLVLDYQYQYQYMFNTLQLNLGSGDFANIANYAGVAKTDWSWSGLLADFDLNGRPEYFVSNGFRRNHGDNDFKIKMATARNQQGGFPPSRREEAYSWMPEVRSSNRLFTWQGDMKFKDVAQEWGLDQLSFSNGAAYGDLDNDGDLDLVVNNIDAEAFLYRNNANEQSENHWLKVIPKMGKTWALNAKVTLKVEGKTYYQEFCPVRGYESTMGHELVFGLGNASRADSLIIEWPDGRIGLLTQLTVDTVLILSADDLKSYKLGRAANPSSLFKKEDPSKMGLNFVHQESDFDEYRAEVLLPHLQSTLGPHISVADINDDGLDDCFIGGGPGQSGVICIQGKNGKFTSKPISIDTDRASEDMGSVFFDADSDGDLDLYVVSGGAGEFADKKSLLQDRLYLNQNGTFTLSKGALPQMHTNGGCVAAVDFDDDGDLDLFVGGQTLPQQYPRPDRSYLLVNEAGKFVDKTAALGKNLLNPGLIYQAEWHDMNKDGKQDLILCGEWMPISIYLNTESGFQKMETGLDDLSGWFYSINITDIDNDGDPDILAGNIGENIKFKASADKPFHIFSNDMDGNGSNDVVLSYYYHSTLVPSRGRECSSEQVPAIAQKFPSYMEFATASLEGVYGAKKLDESYHSEATTFTSYLFKNENGKFVPSRLPYQAQFSPINGIAEVEVGGKSYYVTAGNKFNVEVETPRYDAGRGAVLGANKLKELEIVPSSRSGFYVEGNVKSLVVLNSINNTKLIIAARNDGPLSVHRSK
jgi:hypothetical protein